MLHCIMFIIILELNFLNVDYSTCLQWSVFTLISFTCVIPYLLVVYLLITFYDTKWRYCVFCLGYFSVLSWLSIQILSCELKWAWHLWICANVIIKLIILLNSAGNTCKVSSYQWMWATAGGCGCGVRPWAFLSFQNSGEWPSKQSRLYHCPDK